LVGRQEGHLACKKLEVGCQSGYLSGARCSFAYGPADTIATHCLLLQEIQIGFDFTFLVLAYPGSLRQNPESRKTVVVVVVLVRGPFEHAHLKATGVDVGVNAGLELVDEFVV